MRKAITAAIEGDLIRGSGGGRDGVAGQSSWAAGLHDAYERRDLRANEPRASLSPRMQALEPA